MSAALITGCASDASATASDEPTYTPVKVKTIATNTIRDEVTFSGQLNPIKSIDIYGNYSGEIETIFQGVGDYVTKDTVLFAFDKTDMQNTVDSLGSQLNSAKAAMDSASLNVKVSSGSQKESQLMQIESSLESAKIAFANAQKNYENTATLFNEGFSSKVELDGMEQAYLQSKISYETLEKSYTLLTSKQLSEGIQVAQNQLAQATASKDAMEVQYNNALKTLNDLSVTSPIDGIVAANNIDEGEHYNSAFPAFTVINMDTLTMTVNVPETLIGSIELDDEVRINVEAANLLDMTGHIYEISPVPNNNDLSYPVKISVSNKNHIIKSGMFADVTITINEAKDVIVVSRNSLELSDNHWYAYTVLDSIVTVSEVEVGLDNGIDVEIINGLEVGQQLIVTGQNYVEHEEQVTILETGGE